MTLQSIDARTGAAHGDAWPESTFDEIDATVAAAAAAHDVFAATPAGRWLRANAARFGFEMSFPAGNKQQVKWEPWHWRWVGTTATEAEAAPARSIFLQARTRFPAEPKVD